MMYGFQQPGVPSTLPSQEKKVTDVESNRRSILEIEVFIIWSAEG